MEDFENADNAIPLLRTKERVVDLVFSPDDGGYYLHEARKICQHCHRKFKTTAARRAHQTRMHQREQDLAGLKQPPAKWASDL